MKKILVLAILTLMVGCEDTSGPAACNTVTRMGLHDCRVTDRSLFLTGCGRDYEVAYDVQATDHDNHNQTFRVCCGSVYGCMAQPVNHQ